MAILSLIESIGMTEIGNYTSVQVSGGVTYGDGVFIYITTGTGLSPATPEIIKLFVHGMFPFLTVTTLPATEVT
jgi:hypothetical protein